VRGAQQVHLQGDSVDPAAYRSCRNSPASCRWMAVIEQSQTLGVGAGFRCQVVHVCGSTSVNDCPTVNCSVTHLPLVNKTCRSTVRLTTAMTMPGW
jgi:hypothetical protein